MPALIPITEDINTKLLNYRREGIPIQEIARRLGINKNTIARHLRKLSLMVTQVDRKDDSVELQPSQIQRRLDLGDECLQPLDPISWLPLLNVILSIHFYRPSH